MEKKYDIFISYRKERSVYAELVRNYLIKAGYDQNRIFLDKHNIHAEQFDKKIQNAIKESRCLLLIVSEDCFVSKQTDDNEDWYFKEVRTAIENKITIIPVLFDKIESLEDGNQKILLRQAFTQEEYSFLRNQQTVRYDNDYSEAALSHLVCDFLPKPSQSESITTNYDKFKDVISGLIGLLGVIVGGGILFLCIFGFAFGITYFHEKPADTPTEELQCHVIVFGETAFYSHGRTTAAYNISRDSVLYVNSVKTLVPTLSMASFWGSMSMSPAFSRYMIKLSKTGGGNPRKKVVTMVVGFVAVLFGYSQGEHFATEYCEAKRQILMHDVLWDKRQWNQVIETNKTINGF